MQLSDQRWLFSASDLVGYLECERLTALNLQSLSNDELCASKVQLDEAGQLVARKGDEHERAYLAHLRKQGLTVVDIAEGGGSIEDKVARTLAAMQQGPDVIYQATLRQGQLLGHADFLLRVDGQPSRFGPWRYEVADTKLARSPKAKFLVQLAFYSQLLTQTQGAEPAHMHVVLGDQTQRTYRCADYLHYFQALLQRFLQAIDRLQTGGEAPYPEPCSHCDLCGWRAHCQAQREADDHLCQVANISRVHWRRLQDAGVNTMAKLAALPEGRSLPRMNDEVLGRLRQQAALQDEARRTGQQKVVVLPPDQDGRKGFYRLPEPDAGDMFFDMEGDPLETGGLEYLFGLWLNDGDGWKFKGFWAHNREEERVAFEQFMDFVTERRQRYPHSHIYHYASYEETALKRLSCLHATREQALDHLLRQQVLVDLYKVVREALRISEPSYSIKYVEHFYRPARAGDVQNAGASIVFYERWRETQDPKLLQDIEDYNRDDVESTWQLRDWLLTLRPRDLPWKPVVGDHEAEPGEAPAKATHDKRQQAEERLALYHQRMVAPLPTDAAQRQPEHDVQELLWQLLDFHWRADKPGFWSQFARMDLTQEELMDDPECLGGLTLDPANPPYGQKGKMVYTYLAPEQETKLSDGDAVTRADDKQSLGVMMFDEATRRVVLSVNPTKLKNPMPAVLGLGPSGPIANEVMVAALYRLVDSVLAQGTQYAALRRFLLRELPNLKGRTPGLPLMVPGEDTVAGALEAASALDESYLYVQGPPGAGKTYTGSRMIVKLIKQGKRVGIMSNSHKAINNLLEGVMKVSQAEGLSFTAIKKCTAGKAETKCDVPGVENESSNEEVEISNAPLLAGTAWLFSREAFDRALDYLFVDEAGQVALANLLAAGTCARNLVLLGDQMQLSQPVQGVHPGRSGESALDYLLDGAATIAPERGIFLSRSFRMHPDVCRFISDAVYESRLEPEPGNERRTLVLQPDANRWLKPAGIVHVPVQHQGCSQRSEVEAALVADIYASALQQHYTDRDGVQHRMTPENILVVAPYNVQVNLLKATLPEGARVGTVDKFQGQEAELVIVSMTTSSQDDLPRNIEFLYSRNRLNVAVSRAKCLAVVLANPELMAIKCQTPEQMALVNTLCWLGSSGSA